MRRHGLLAGIVIGGLLLLSYALPFLITFVVYLAAAYIIGLAVGSIIWHAQLGLQVMRRRLAGERVDIAHVVREF